MTPSPDRPDDDVPGAARYVIVWGLLVALATASLIASQLVAAPWALVVALAIAALKASLVAVVFMHLARGPSLHRIVFAVAIGFVVLLVLGVLADVGTRSVASTYIDDGGAAP